MKIFFKHNKKGIFLKKYFDCVFNFYLLFMLHTYTDGVVLAAVGLDTARPLAGGGSFSRFPTSSMFGAARTSRQVLFMETNTTASITFIVTSVTNLTFGGQIFEVYTGVF